MRKLIGAFLLLFLCLFCSVAFAHDANISRYMVNGRNADGQSFLVFNNYTVTGTVEQFSGSSTVNGGTTTVSAGYMDVSDNVGDKNVFYNVTAVTGSITVNVYAFFGTSTINGTRSAYRASTQIITTAGTTTVVNIPQYCRGVAMSVFQSQAGTSTITAGLETARQK